MDHIQSATPFCKTWKFQEGESAFSKCQCLQILIDTTNDKDTDTSDNAESVIRVKEDANEAVALYMIWFFELKNKNREQIIIDWIHYTEHERGFKNHKRFFIPLINLVASDDDNDGIIEASTLDLEQLNSNLICRSALRHLLHIGRSTWNRCHDAVNNNIMPYHGLSKRRSNKGKKFDDLVRDDIMWIFERVGRFIEATVNKSDTSCNRNREGEDGVTYLPNYFLRRGMHNCFCTERGWTLEYLDKGDYKASAETEESLPICSWYKFRSFWKEKYPKLCLGFATEDVCTMCHVFHNKMKYKLKEKEDADRRASGALSNTDDGETGNNGNDSSDDDIVGNSDDDDSNDEPPGVLLEENTCGTVLQGRLRFILVVVLLLLLIFLSFWLIVVVLLLLLLS